MPSLRYSVIENNCGHLNFSETFVLYFKRALLHYNLLSIAWCISFMSYLLFMVYVQILKPSEKKAKYQYLSLNTGQATRPSTPQRNPAKKKWQPCTRFFLHLRKLVDKATKFLLRREHQEHNIVWYVLSLTSGYAKQMNSKKEKKNRKERVRHVVVFVIVKDFNNKRQF